MIYIRGNPLDYDEWGPGWTWDELLPYFKRAEDNERGEDDYHGGRRPAPGVRGPVAQPARSALPRRRRVARIPGERGLQRRGAGRRRLVPGNAPERRPRQHRRRLSAPGHEPAEPDRRDARARALDPVRGRPRGRRRGRAPQRDDRAARRARGDRVRRRVQLAAAADAVRARPARGARGAPDRGGRGGPRDRPEPARSPELRGRLLDRRGDLAVRRAERGEPGAVRGRGPRAAHLERRGGRRLPPDARRPGCARHPAPLRARPASRPRGSCPARGTGSRSARAC